MPSRRLICICVVIFIIFVSYFLLYLSGILIVKSTYYKFKVDAQPQVNDSFSCFQIDWRMVLPMLRPSHFCICFVIHVVFVSYMLPIFVVHFCCISIIFSLYIYHVPRSIDRCFFCQSWGPVLQSGAWKSLIPFVFVTLKVLTLQDSFHAVWCQQVKVKPSKTSQILL